MILRHIFHWTKIRLYKSIDCSVKFYSLNYFYYLRIVIAQYTALIQTRRKHSKEIREPFKSKDIVADVKCPLRQRTQNKRGYLEDSLAAENAELTQIEKLC